MTKILKSYELHNMLQVEIASTLCVKKIKNYFQHDVYCHSKIAFQRNKIHK